MKSRTLCCLLAAVSVIATAGAVRAEEPDAEQTRRIMREVFGAIQRLLPASLDADRFADPALEPELRAALETLSQHSGRLAAHGTRGDQSFAFLSRSLARDAADIQRRFAAGRTEEARFLLHQITEDCIACHSRLPDADDAPLSSAFMDDEAFAALPLPERARFAVATRQFERALVAYEEIFASPAFDAGSIELLGELDDYLEICLRVKRDFERPARTFETFIARDDIRPMLADELRVWIADLRALGARDPIEGLAPARELVREAEEASPIRERREKHVRYHAASAALHRHLASLPAGDRRAAEVYYWLGVIESRVGRSFWLSETEPFLEAAIRLDPASPLALESYALLEEFVVAGYTGSSGEHVPPDVQAWLAELQSLILHASGEDTD